MNLSADWCRPTRAQRRRATQLRISRVACRLVMDRGFDGFTMEDLAAACDVSRRTLFNYFGSKTDAVLGPAPEFPAEAIDAFRSGGPTGDLVDDLRLLALAAFDDAEVSREDAAMHHAIAADPHLFRVLRERFGALTDQVRQEISVREGEAYDPTGARVAISVLIAVFEIALSDYADGTTDDFAQHFIDVTDHLRALLRQPTDPSHSPGPTHKEAT